MGALLVSAAPAARADDVAVVTASQQIRVGSLVLGPGAYLLRSDSSMGTRNVILVSSLDEKTFHGLVLANHDCSPSLVGPEDRLVFDEADGRTLRTWIVGWRGVGYFLSPAPVSPALAARARVRVERPVAAR